MKTYTEEKRIRPDVLTGCVYLAFAFIMVYSIVCYRIYGENGAFFSALPFSIYIFAYCALVLAVQKAVYIMVRIRARRSQYLNAETNMHRSMNVFVVLSLLIGLLFIGISFITARNLLGSDYYCRCCHSFSRATGSFKRISSGAWIHKAYCDIGSFDCTVYLCFRHYCRCCVVQLRT